MENKKTAVFIDHESWFYGMNNLHGETPDTETVLDLIEKNNEVVIKKSFGNLPVQDGTLERERNKLKQFGYELETTFEGNIKGDLTDFVLADSIYRVLMKNPEIKKFIIISGDAHYLQVIRTLKEFGKEVEIWAVIGTISAVFNEYSPIVIYPKINKDIIDKIIEELYIFNALSKKATPSILSSSVSKKYKIDEPTVQKEIIMLISKGYIKETTYFNRKGKKSSCLIYNPDKAKTYSLI